MKHSRLFTRDSTIRTFQWGETFSLEWSRLSPPFTILTTMQTPRQPHWGPGSHSLWSSCIVGGLFQATVRVSLPYRNSAVAHIVFRFYQPLMSGLNLSHQYTFINMLHNERKRCWLCAFRTLTVHTLESMVYSVYRFFCTLRMSSMTPPARDRHPWRRPPRERYFPTASPCILICTSETCA